MKRSKLYKIVIKKPHESVDSVYNSIEQQVVHSSGQKDVSS